MKLLLINILEKSVIIVLIIFLSGAQCLAADNNKLPDWVVDTINLPVPSETDRFGLYVNLFQDNNNKYYINYGYRNNNKQWINNWVDIKSHEVKENVSQGWVPNAANKSIGYDLFSSLRQITNTPYSCVIDHKYRNCDTPFNYWLKFTREGKALDNYMLIVSSNRKFTFQSGEDCWGMNGKMVIKINNLCLFPSLWPMNDELLLMGDSHTPYLVVIDTKKMDQAFLSNKTIIFENRGTKVYWVKASIVEQWIKKGVNLSKGKKMNITLNEYVDQYITKELNK